MKLIVILGPTASGKTELAIKLAKKFGGEIINADSRTIYKGLDIGTAKPRKDKKQKTKYKKDYLVDGIPHHLIDFLEPDQDFSVAEYQKLARQKIKEIQKRGKIPFLVGGSMFYIDSVIYGYKFPKVAPDFSLRKKLGKESLEKLIQKLSNLDPELYGNIDFKNKRRVIRALEISLKTGKEQKKPNRKSLSQNILILGIKTDREELYRKINKRVDFMIKRGLVREVRRLYKKYGESASALSGIGYRQIIQYLEGEISQDEVRELIKRDSRRFAKRQLTWFRRNKNIKWISEEEQAEIFINPTRDRKRFNKTLP